MHTEPEIISEGKGALQAELDWQPGHSTVTKSNDLIEAGYALTLNEQRLVLMAIGFIDPRKPMKNRVLTIEADDFSKAYDIERRHAYKALEEGAERLWDRSVRTYDKDLQVREVTRWVSQARYDHGKGCVTISMAPEIMPFLTLLSRRFTSYELQYIAQLSTPYAIRLYELLKQYQKIGEREITIERLKAYLDLGGSYERFANLKARVIEPAVKQINKYTDIEVSWQPIRKKRVVVGLRFLISEQPQQSLPI